MKNKKLYSGHRYPVEIISHAVWLNHRLTLSLRDIEEILALRSGTQSGIFRVLPTRLLVNSQFHREEIQ